jgi:CheY-like chemotaxis protein
MRILLVHWNRAESAGRVGRLEAAGNSVTVHSDPRDPSFLKRAREAPPDAVVIDLSRLPSQGRAVGGVFRRQKATREVPIVFVGGEPEKVARTRKELPDATYAEWRTIRSALRRATARRSTAPSVPGAMAGYSGTPLPRKLGFKAGQRVLLLGAPRDFDRTLGDLPGGVRVVRRGSGRGAVVLLFRRTRSELERDFEKAARATAEGGRLWIVWPKKTSPLARDLDGNRVRATGLARDWVDFKICAIDDDWSGLCFARRAR